MHQPWETSAHFCERELVRLGENTVEKNTDWLFFSPKAALPQKPPIWGDLVLESHSGQQYLTVEKSTRP